MRAARPRRPGLGLPCLRNGGTCPCGPDCPTCHGADATGSTTGSSASTSTAGTTSTNGSTAATDGATTGGSTAATATGGSTSGDPSTGGSTGADAGYTAGDTATAGGADDWDHTNSGVDLGPDAVNGKVSGTNVNFTVAVALTKPSGSPYTDVLVDRVLVGIGGEADSVVTISNAQNAPTPPFPTSGSGDSTSFARTFRLRYASTRFKDGATVALRARVLYRLWNPTTNAQTGLLHYDLTQKTVTTYNRGLALLTDLYVSNCESYVYDLSSPTNYYNSDSKNAILARSDGTGAANRLGAGTGQINHSLVNASQDLDRASVLNGLNAMTAFFAYTHGETDGFLPFYGSASNKDAVTADKMAFDIPQFHQEKSEVGRAVYGGPNQPDGATRPARAYPRPNMVVLHARSTLGSGVTAPLRAFGLVGPGGSQGDASGMDRALAAFPLVVSSVLSPPHGSSQSSHELSEHARQVYAFLAQGQTLSRALDLTQSAPGGPKLVPKTPIAQGMWTRCSCWLKAT